MKYLLGLILTLVNRNLALSDNSLGMLTMECEWNGPGCLD